VIKEREDKGKGASSKKGIKGRGSEEEGISERNPWEKV